MRAWSPALAILAGLHFSGCFDLEADSGNNPPPRRLHQQTIAPPQPTQTGPYGITTNLLAELDRASLELPDGSTNTPLGPASRAYQNPWRRSPLDQRVVWVVGTRNQWNQRAALTLPASGSVRWPLQAPAGARLSLGVSAALPEVGTKPQCCSHSGGAFGHPHTPPFGASPISSTVLATLPRVVVRCPSGERAGGPAECLSERHSAKPSDAPTAGTTPPSNVTVTIELHTTGGSRVLSRTVATATPADGPKTVEALTLPLGEVPTGPTTLTIRADGPPNTVALLFEPVIQAPLPPVDNVLLVVVDAQRADTVGRVARRHGIPRLFDTMERLVDEGVEFTQAFSVGNQTRLSTYAFLSGQTPGHGRFHQPEWDFLPEAKQRFYAGNPPLLPRILSRTAGYRTVAIGNNAFLFGQLEIGLDAGFATVIDHRHRVRDTPWMTDTAINWLEAHRDERWMMMLNYNSPHWPYVPPDESWIPFKPRLTGIDRFKWGYLGEIQWADEHLARVLAALERLNLRKNTLVVLTADHGEVMDPRHDCFNDTIGQECLFNHGMTLYDEEVHVPLIVHQPGRILPGHIDQPVSQVDLAPTILGLLNQTPPPEQLGRNFAPALRGGEAPEDAPLLLQARFSTGFRYQGLKYIAHDPAMQVTFHNPDQYDPLQGNEEVYDLRTDPNELKNIVHEIPPELLTSLRRAMAHYRPALLAERGVVDTSPTNVFRARGATVTGFISADGTIDTITLDDEQTRLSTPVLRADGALAVHLEPGQVLRFRTQPPDAALTLALEQGGAPLMGSSLLIGAYGLALLDSATRLDGPTLSNSHTTSTPGGGTDGPPGLFFWREGEVFGDEVRSDGLDADVKRMMKDWGYTGR